MLQEEVWIMTSGPYTVTIPVGQTTATFNVPINDDDMLEGNENFMLTVSSSSLPDGVALGTPSEATVIIMDNDIAIGMHFVLVIAILFDFKFKVIALIMIQYC